MGKKNDKKNTEKKTAAPKERKQRAVMRSRKVSPAGHFADRLAANVKQRADIMKAVAAYPGISDAQNVVEVTDVLNQLAADGFVPERKKGGRKGVTFAPGQKVMLEPDAINLLKTLFVAAGINDASEFFVSDGYTAQPKDTQLPLRLGSSALDATPLGFVSKKWASPVVSA
jgi:hypothetical protein